MAATKALIDHFRYEWVERVNKLILRAFNWTFGATDNRGDAPHRGATYKTFPGRSFRAGNLSLTKYLIWFYRRSLRGIRTMQSHLTGGDSNWFITAPHGATFAFFPMSDRRTWPKSITIPGPTMLWRTPLQTVAPKGVGPELTGRTSVCEINHDRSHYDGRSHGTVVIVSDCWTNLVNDSMSKLNKTLLQRWIKFRIV